MPQFTLAVDPDPLPILPPSDTVVIAQDDFTAPDGTLLETYTGGTGFVAPASGVTTSWAENYTLTSNCVANKLFIKNNQLTVVPDLKGEGQGNGGFDIYRGLATPIDLDVDGEYYITFRTNTPQNQKDSSATIGFGIPTNGQQQHGIGISTTGGKNNSGVGAVGPVSYTTGQAIFGARYSRRNLTNSNKMYTVVARLSTRVAGKQDIMRVKSFADGEQPTFTPSSWDIESCTNTAGVMSWSRLGMSNGTGSKYFPILDNFAVYKGAPVYVTKSYDGEWAIPGQTITISVPATNALNNSQSIQSIEWTKNDGVNTTVINTTASYVVPANLVG